MRILGLLFLIVLVVAGIGYFRGWFSVTTAHAAGRKEIIVGVDDEMIDDDTKAVATALGDLSAKAAEALKSLGRKVGADETELDGVLTAVDHAARDLTLTAGGKAIELHVPAAVSITRDGTKVGVDQLLADMRVKCTFQYAGDRRRLLRILILP